MLNVEKVLQNNFQQGSCFQHALLGLKALKLNIQVREAFACGHTKRHFFLREEINTSVHSASLDTNFIVLKFCRIAVVSVE